MGWLDEVYVQEAHFLNCCLPLLKIKLSWRGAQKGTHVDLTKTKPHAVAREQCLQWAEQKHAVVVCVTMCLDALKIIDYLLILHPNYSGLVASNYVWVVTVESFLAVHFHCAWYQLGVWVHNVGYTSGMGVDSGTGKLLYQHPGSARVIQMDMSNKNILDLLNRDIFLLQILQDVRHGESRANFYDRVNTVVLNVEHSAELVSQEFRVYTSD